MMTIYSSAQQKKKKKKKLANKSHLRDAINLLQYFDISLMGIVFLYVYLTI